MPWYFFNNRGIQDIPDTESSLITGQILMSVSPRSGPLGSSVQAKSAPAGFLFCNGASMVITEFQALYDSFTADSVTFGAAGPGLFKVPNFFGRFPIGLDTGVVAYNTIGKTGGAATHTHSSAGLHAHALAPHTHSLTNHVHDLNAHTHTIPNHAHDPVSQAGNFHNLDSYGSPVTGVNVRAGSDRSVAAPTHGHDVNGLSGFTTLVSSGPRLNGVVWDTTSNMFSIPSSGMVSAPNSNNESNASLFGSIGNDSIPPYYSVNYMIKT